MPKVDEKKERARCYEASIQILVGQNYSLERLSVEELAEKSKKHKGNSSSLAKKPEKTKAVYEYRNPKMNPLIKKHLLLAPKDMQEKGGTLPEKGATKTSCVIELLARGAECR
ncbi:MAG: hypothetical protein MI919_36125 [Holophagales bacterium]|nr:hypothetical protein [Holophagales bacterium]